MANMSESGQEKTEEATARRLSKARSKGQVAKSQDLNTAITLTAALALLSWLGPYTFGNLYGIAGSMFANLPTKPITQAEFISILTNLLSICGLIILPFSLGVMTIAIISNLLQIKPLFTTHPLMPNLEKINPLSGAKKFFSRRSLVEVAKNLVKTIIIGWAGYAIVSGHLLELMTLNDSDVYTAAGVIWGVMGELGTWTCILFIVMGGADYFYQLYEFKQSMKMTKQEVKEDRKEDEMDANIKGRIKQMGMQFTKRKQLAAVPKADVVIANPTHYAIALQYDPDIAPAPRVIAKGHDDFALQIKEVAKANKVPIVENKPLARSLYAMVEVEKMIPADLFVAVAEVLAFVFSKNKGRGLKNKKR